MSETDDKFEGRDMFSPLQEYMRYVCERSVLRLRPPRGGIFSNRAGIKEGHMISVILDRHGQFQTELFILSPEIRKVKAHTHPGVDSIELSVSGEFKFVANGIEYPTVTSGQRIGDNMSVVVLEDSPHGAFATEGACFLSFQFWKQQEPSSVGNSFEITTEGGDLYE